VLLNVKDQYQLINEAFFTNIVLINPGLQAGVFFDKTGRIQGCFPLKKILVQYSSCFKRRPIFNY